MAPIITFRPKSGHIGADSASADNRLWSQEERVVYLDAVRRGDPCEAEREARGNASARRPLVDGPDLDAADIRDGSAAAELGDQFNDGGDEPHGSIYLHFVSRVKHAIRKLTKGRGAYPHARTGSLLTPWHYLLRP
jgi:hypothetical protein